MSEEIDEIRINRHPRKPKHQYRDRCKGEGCRRAVQRGGLCSDCESRFLVIVNERLSQYGITTTDRLAITPDGYLQIRVGNRFMGEHRVVMKHHLGREYYPGENVHHLNGCRTDNRIENLELWVSIQPSGQRPSDLVKYAHEILARYASDQKP